MCRILAGFLLVTVAFPSWGQAGERLQAPRTKKTYLNDIAPTPEVIDETPERRRCPEGFSLLGEQCAKQLTAHATFGCPIGMQQDENKCVKYSGKQAECPSGYEEVKGTCSKRESFPYELTCPQGYHLFEDDMCIMKIALPDVKVCPPGTIAKGEKCFIKKLRIPEFVCPSGFELLATDCRLEEEYDCTPLRSSHFLEDGGAAASRLRQSNSSMSKSLRISVENYVVEKTCKKIVLERAMLACPGGELQGNLCSYDVPVHRISQPGGFKDQKFPADKECHRGYLNDNSCVLTDTILPKLVCPPGTSNVRDKCGLYSPGKWVCPEGYSLHEHICRHTIFALPIVEFKVTYNCSGDDCDHAKA